jgi:hypothetical protein
MEKSNQTNSETIKSPDYVNGYKAALEKVISILDDADMDYYEDEGAFYYTEEWHFVYNKIKKLCTSMETSELRNKLSALLMHTSEENHLETYIPLDFEEGMGLSTNDMPAIKEIWQHPIEGIIMLKIWGINEPIELEDLCDYEEVLPQIIEGVKDSLE